MTELEKYELVNKAESMQQLEEAITKIGDSGLIMGRNKPFKTEQQVAAVQAICNGYPANLLTRQYGIRQQMLYLMHYGGKR